MTETTGSHKWITMATIPLLVALSIGLKFVLFSALGPDGMMMPDSQTYLAPAANLIEYSAFLNASLTPETIRTPGYPSFIALSFILGTGVTGVIAMQYAIAIGLALMMGWLILKESPFAAALTLSLILFNVLMAVYSNLVLSEMLFTGLVMSTFALLVRGAGSSRPKMLIILAAMAAGMAALTRPIACLFFLPAVIYIVWCYPKKKLKLAGLFLLLFICFPLSWMARNDSVTEAFTLSGIGSYNLIAYQAALTLAESTPGDFDENLLSARNELFAAAQTRYQESRTTDPSITMDTIYGQIAMETIQSHPVGFIRATMRNVAMTLLGNASTFMERAFGITHEIARTLSLLYTIPAAFFVCIGLLFGVKKHPSTTLLSILFIGYFIGIAALGGAGGSRFRVPVEPVFCLLIAFGVEGVCHLIKSIATRTAKP